MFGDKISNSSFCYSIKRPLGAGTSHGTTGNASKAKVKALILLEISGYIYMVCIRSVCLQSPFAAAAMMKLFGTPSMVKRYPYPVKLLEDKSAEKTMVG